MAGLFRQSRVNNQDTPATALRVQTSIQSRAKAIGCGRFRVAGNMIDYGGFVATPGNQGGGGKGGLAGGGGKGQSSDTTYTASTIISIGDIQVVEWLTILNGNSYSYFGTLDAQTLADLNAIGIDPTFEGYNVSFYNGTYTQTPDAFWAATFPQNALSYHGEAYAMFPNYPLGSSPSFPNLTFEVQTAIGNDVPALGPDANPADWIEDFLTNADWGVPGFSSALIGDFDTARNYWRATGLLISDLLTDQTAANSYLSTLMTALNADFRWSSGKLDIVVYGDVATTGNGYTFNPDVTPIYDLGPDDFLPNQGTLGTAATSAKQFVAFSRTNINDTFNKVQLEYLDRSNLYNPVTIYANDDASIAATGRLRISDLKTNHFFALEEAASVSVALQLHRVLSTINSYQATLGRQYALLDVMDIVTLTEPALQLDRQLVRITEIQENLDSTLTLTFEEVGLTAGVPVYARQASLGLGRNNNVAPGNVNAPYFFEPPDQLGKGLVLLIGLSGEDVVDWGGCDVWVSTDQETYAKIGSITGATRMGALTAPLASFVAAPMPPTIDTANTLSVDLTESDGELVGGSAADLAAFNTACVVDQEVLAYQGATLTGANQYALTTLSRGGYGSTIAAHAVAAQFMRLDGSAFAWDFTSDRIGKTLYFKFPSFNTHGVATEQLSDVGPYAYTVTGAALSSPLPAITDLYTNYVGGFQQIHWDEIVDFRSGILYEIRQGASFSNALVLKTQAHPPFNAQGNGTFWIVARCTPIAGLVVYGEPESITISGNQLSLNLIKSFDEQATGWNGTFDTGVGTDGVGADKFLRLGGSQDILATSPFLESAATSSATASGSILNFASLSAAIVEGMAVADTTHTGRIAPGTTISSRTLTSVTLSTPVLGAGVGSGDTIVFSIADVLAGGGVPTNQALYYTSDEIIDVGYLAQASVNATTQIAGVPVGQDILSIANILTTPDILGSASTAFVSGWVEVAIATDTNDAFAPADAFAAADAFEGPLTWGPWQKIIPGVQPGRAFKFRLALMTSDPNSIPYALAFNYQVQVVGRLDHYQGLSVPISGLTISFVPDSGSNVGAFNGGPAANDEPYVNVSWQAVAGDTFVISNLTLTGLTIQFFNGGSAVARTGVNITVEGF